MKVIFYTFLLAFSIIFEEMSSPMTCASDAASCRVKGIPVPQPMSNIVHEWGRLK